jgi:hypothetical protein
MGMYTLFHLNAELKKDTPAMIINTIDFMTGELKEKPSNLPDHILFTGDTRWRFMLQCDSYYFSAKTHSRLIRDSQHILYLNIQCNFKNYKSEIDLFLDWIKPYLDAYEGGFLGYKMYEEDTKPTLIFMGDF